jgi:hypothetical protein
MVSKGLAEKQLRAIEKGLSATSVEVLQGDRRAVVACILRKSAHSLSQLPVGSISVSGGGSGSGNVPHVATAADGTSISTDGLEMFFILRAGDPAGT